MHDQPLDDQHALASRAAAISAEIKPSRLYYRKRYLSGRAAFTPTEQIEFQRWLSVEGLHDRKAVKRGLI